MLRTCAAQGCSPYEKKDDQSHRAYYMSAHVLLNFIKQVDEKRLNARLAEHFISFATSLINSIIQEHEC